MIASAILGIALNTAVTQQNIQQTICVPGYTQTVRPPVAYTNRIKFKLMQQQGIPRARAGDYELDHHINLGIGGHPSDPSNLQLQDYERDNGARAKDVVEAQMQRMVCHGRIKLAAAQECMARDFTTCPK